MSSLRSAIDELASDELDYVPDRELPKGGSLRLRLFGLSDATAKGRRLVP